MKNLIQISVIALSLSMPFFGKAMMKKVNNPNSVSASVKEVTKERLDDFFNIMPSNGAVPSNISINGIAVDQHTAQMLYEFIAPQEDCDRYKLRSGDITVLREYTKASAFPYSFFSWYEILTEENTTMTLEPNFASHDAKLKQQTNTKSGITYSRRIIYSKPFKMKHPINKALTVVTGACIGASALKFLKWSNNSIAKTIAPFGGLWFAVSGVRNLLKYRKYNATKNQTFDQTTNTLDQMFDDKMPYGASWAKALDHIENGRSSYAPGSIYHDMTTEERAEADEFNKSTKYTTESGQKLYENFVDFKQDKLYKRGIKNMIIGSVIALTPFIWPVAASILRKS